jgi:hypothetical protein
MRAVHKAILVNGAALLGFVIAAVAAPNTSAVIFGIACLVALVLINTLVFLLPWLRLRQGQRPESTAKSPQETTIILVLAWVLFLGVTAVLWMERHGH